MNATEVFAPASIGNAAVGFDVMGLALDRPGDAISIRLSDKTGLRIVRITGDGGKLSMDPKRNTAGVAAMRLLEHLGETGRGIDMELHKRMPVGSGLGSSAASAVAGAFAVNELLGQPLEKKELLPFALQGEFLASGGMHADNVAPCLLGGFLLIRDHATLDIQRLPTPAGMHATVIYPQVEVLTKEARSILSATVPMRNFVEQNANLGAFIIGMYNNDAELLGRSLRDVVIEPQRARLIPRFYEVKEAALHAGALGCSISGSGPSIFALSMDRHSAEAIGEAMQRAYAGTGIESEVFISPINQQGATVL